MADDQQFPEGIRFFPEYLSDEKTRQIQTTPSPLPEGYPLENTGFTVE